MVEAIRSPSGVHRQSAQRLASTSRQRP